MTYPTLRLKPKKESSLQRFHPWVFSGALQQIPTDIADGGLVKLVSQQGNFMGIGHYQNASISVRILSFTDTEINASFFAEKIENALQTRVSLNLLNNKKSTIYRLVHAEGDALPGLIIDVYNEVFVVQCHSIGMHKQLNEISEAIQLVFKKKVKAIFNKSSATLPKEYAANNTDAVIYGKSDAVWAKENGLEFYIDFEHGQKTGFFIDQRENRELLAKYAKGKTVLNTFAYTGGFSVYALQAEATKVVSVDSSQSAIEIIDKNVAKNIESSANHQSVSMDVFEYFKTSEEKFDIIILDPPAFAKHRSAIPNAIKGYRRLNEAAMQKLNKGGLIFSFSCSQAIDTETFRSAIFSAALNAKKQIKVVHKMGQAADHPVSIYHPEGDYLKGLVYQVQ